MKTTKLIFGLAFSVLASSAFALPVVTASDLSNAPVVAEGGTKHTNVGSIRAAADGADRVGANRQAADVLTMLVQTASLPMVLIASVQTARLPMVLTTSVQTVWPLMVQTA